MRTDSPCGRVGVAAEAFAKSQTTTQSSVLGSQSFISGSTGKFVLGETISSASEEANNWLLERQQQSFDAVVVLSGVSVGIHVTEELNIDYDLDGRKLRHDPNTVSFNDTLP